MAKFFSKTVCFLGMIFFMTVSSSWAAYMADISYDYTAIAGGYALTFKVENNSTGLDTGSLDYFEISFDSGGMPAYGDYSDITWLNTKAWNGLVAPFDPAFAHVPAAVTADDALIFGGSGGIAKGASIGGFKVSFKYAGAIDPKLFNFSWRAEFGTNDQQQGIDQGGYYVLGLDRGNINYVPGTPPTVPEPATMVLFGLGLLGVAGIGRKK